MPTKEGFTDLNIKFWSESKWAVGKQIWADIKDRMPKKVNKTDVSLLLEYLI